MAFSFAPRPAAAPTAATDRSGKAILTRHRSTPGARASVRRVDDPATGTQPLPVATRGGARHRSPGRSAVRHGVLAAGITGGALALVAPPTLELAAQQDGTLALSTQQAGIGPAPTAAAPVQPVQRPVVGGATSADLIKASDRQRRQVQAAADRDRAQRADADRRAAAAKAAEKERTSLSCGVSESYGGVADSVQSVGNAMECVFPGHDVLGVGSRGNASDHPGGYALDFMTKNTADGNRIAECVMANQDALNVSYAIWNQRINTGSGWKGMEDRGGATANHEDHVHISFDKGGSPNVAALKRCS